MKTLALLIAVPAAVVGYWYAAALLFPGDDNGLGAGLVLFLLLLNVAVAGGLWDGMHEFRLVPVVLRWLLVACAVGVALAVVVWVNEESRETLLIEDITGNVEFMAVWMGAPAVFFGWLGWFIGGRKRPDERNILGRGVVSTRVRSWRR
jgi:hypothetical protein